MSWQECFDFLRSQYEQVNGLDFYREIFPTNENSGEKEHGKDTGKYRANAIYLFYDEEKKNKDRKLSRRIMLKNTWEEDYINYVEQNEMTLCSGLAYRGRANTLENARQMNALIIDLDAVGIEELKNLVYRFGADPRNGHTHPIPTFLVLSGTGVHVYYLFDEPIDLYPNIKIQLKNWKYKLTFRLWDYGSTTQLRQIQYQSINQGFRMVGSINNKYGNEVVAFRIGEKVTVDYINVYTHRNEDKLDLRKKFKPGKISLDEAKEKYPEWYDRVIVKGIKKTDNKWHVNRAVYDWWKNRANEIRGGHRYFFLMCLAIYAYKCEISKKELKEDMLELLPELQKVNHTNEMTEEDVKSALEAYDKCYYNYTIKDIEYLTDLRIDKNKRNGRKQIDHLVRARAVQNVDYPDGSWRNKDGRPKGSSVQRNIVLEWRNAHPEGIKAECIRDTKLSKPTVYRWWNFNGNINDSEKNGLFQKNVKNN